MIRDMSCVDLCGNFIACPKIDYSKVCNSGYVPNLDISGLMNVNWGEDASGTPHTFPTLVKYRYQPLVTFLIALVLLIVYSVIGIFYYEGIHTGLYKLFTSKDSSWEKTNRQLSVYRFLLFLCLFGILLFFIFFLVYRALLKGKDTVKPIIVISTCISSILGLTFLMIHNTTFVKIFENTIGYGIIQLIWGNELNGKLKSLFTHSFLDPLDDTVKGVDFSYHFILSLLQLENFQSMWEDIKNGKAGVSVANQSVSNQPVGDNTDKSVGGDTTKYVEIEKYLYKSVVLKNTVGHMCWVYFASLVATLVSIRYLK
jgi:hypothetical protein